MLSLYIAQPMVDNHRRSLNTKNGMRRAQKSGRYMATAPIGYKNSRDEQGKSMIILDSAIVQPSGKSKSELLRELFYDFATGTYQQEEVRFKYWQKGLRIPRSRIRPILENPVYTGKVKIKAYEDEPEQIVHGLHDPLVSEEIFNRVDRVLNKPKEDKSKYSKRSSDFPLRGEVTCRSCNKPLTGSFSKSKTGKKYGYYHCNHPCKSRVGNKKVDEWVESTLNKIKPSKEVVALYQEVLKKELRLKNGDIEKELKNIESQISTLQIKKKSVEEKFIDDLIDADTYKIWKTNIGKELDDFELRKEQIQKGFNQTLKDLQKAAQLITELSKLYKQAEPKDKKTIVSSIFSENLSVEKNEIQTPRFNQVVELICAPTLNKRGFKNKKGNALHEHSRWVTPTGFKPVTLRAEI
ncbi:MAG: recombinase family protein [Bacteroidia bacterium]